jgi:hypothetical protein
VVHRMGKGQSYDLNPGLNNFSACSLCPCIRDRLKTDISIYVLCKQKRVLQEMSGYHEQSRNERIKYVLSAHSVQITSTMKFDSL